MGSRLPVRTGRWLFEVPLLVHGDLKDVEALDFSSCQRVRLSVDEVID